jgi:hypothetical protein
MGADPPQARDGTRTRDLFLTKEVLYRLSYASTRCGHSGTNPSHRLSPRPDHDGTAMSCSEQARRDSNPQPPVLETGALPIELLTYTDGQGGNRTPDTTIFSRVLYQLSYLAQPHPSPHRPEKPPSTRSVRSTELPGLRHPYCTPPAKNRANRRRRNASRPTKIRQTAADDPTNQIAGAGFEPATFGL